MYMILRDTRFAIKSATLSGYINSPDSLDLQGKRITPELTWSIEIDMEAGLLLGCEYSPLFSFDYLKLPVQNWFDLEGKSIDFQAPYDDNFGPRALSYFWSHEYIPTSTFTFFERIGPKFRVKWEGLCNPWLNEPFEVDVPFSLEVEATFVGIGVGGDENDSDEIMRERLSLFLDVGNLTQLPHSEISTAIHLSTFKPKVEVANK